MKNKIDDLRDHLFETLEALKDEDNPMEIERAKAISDVAGTLIESAKVEVKFLEVTNSAKPESDFFKPKESIPPAKPLKAISSSANLV